MISRVSHLVDVGPAGADEIPVRPPRRSAAIKARAERIDARASDESQPTATPKKVTKATKVAKSTRSAGAVKAQEAQGPEEGSI